jgi:hypothetical protein
VVWQDITNGRLIINGIIGHLLPEVSDLTVIFLQIGGIARITGQFLSDGLRNKGYIDMVLIYGKPFRLPVVEDLQYLGIVRLKNGS